MTVALSIEHLTVSFPGPRERMRVIEDVSLSIGSGEIVGLVGESGCGKTTLGRAILQLVYPSSGEVILNGKNINSIKLDSIHLGLGGQVNHRVEINGWFGVRAFAHESRPHRIVNLGILCDSQRLISLGKFYRYAILINKTPCCPQLLY